MGRLKGQPISLRELRDRLGMSQAQFASRFALNYRTLQDWEQGRSQPEPTVCAYLLLIERDPAFVEETLKAATAAVRDRDHSVT